MSSCPSPTHPRRHSRQRQGDVLVLGVRSDLVACGGEGLRIQRRYLTSSPVTEALTWHGSAMVAIVGIVLFIRCPAGRWNPSRFTRGPVGGQPTCGEPCGPGNRCAVASCIFLSVWPFHRSSLRACVLGFRGISSLRCGIPRPCTAALPLSIDFSCQTGKKIS